MAQQNEFPFIFQGSEQERCMMGNDEHLRRKVQQTYTTWPYTARKLHPRNIELIEIEPMDDELSVFTFVRVQDEYGIVTEDDPNNTIIQTELSDGRIWRVPRQMVYYDNNPPARVQEEFKRLLPRCNNAELITKPSLYELRMMNPSQLASVRDFEIVHKPTSSRVLFRGKTDLRCVDIHEAVCFSESAVDFYPEMTPPSFNTKLNREAYVELQNCFPRDERVKCDIIEGVDTAIEYYSRRLKRLCESHGARFVSYKPEENGRWAFVFNGMK